MSKPVSKVREAKLEFYRKKGKIHAKATEGRFNSLRWAMVWFTQIIFYGACWLSWESNGLDRQAILFDIAVAIVDTAPPDRGRRARSA